ncbi:MAG: uracil-DNA glycosylase [Chloroflexota bacterium]
MKEVRDLSPEELAERVKACTDCRLSQGRNLAVPGEGKDGSILFVGEGPGWHEDQMGRPFVGPAGKFLEELLGSIGLKREEVFITNMVKCRPPGNRDPLPDEIETCRKYLDRQIELLRPRAIVSLGRHSLARFFPGKTISQVHGSWRKEDSTIYFAMYHPAAALHQGSLRKVIQEDILKLPQAIREAEKGRGEKPTRQLSFF